MQPLQTQLADFSASGRAVVAADKGCLPSTLRAATGRGTVEKSMVIVDIGQLPAPIRQLRYAPAPGADLGVEVLGFEQLRRMDPDRRRTRPQRPDFHVLALVRSGEGRHEADFADHHLRPGSVVWIRPGTVHRWTDIDHVDGPLILFEPGFLPAPGPAAHAGADPFASSTWRLDGRARELALLATDHLAAEYAAALTEPAASPPLLAHTDLPAARCAERVGFTDAANFTAFFQRQTGLPPSRWRSTHSGR
ncbi:AraC family transcriptional regulator [Streptomyces decoyicus]|uniref:AraC family transcriptional regulator n=1 Tax=Streptomyces decoyicus TaxID=249567 RepID=UPI00363D15B1